MKKAKFLSPVVFILLLISITHQSCQQAGGKKTNEAALPVPKNILIFIGDGMGYNHVDAANYFEYGKSKAQKYQQPGWVSLSMSTYPSVTSINENDTLFAHGYNPVEASTNPEYLKKDATDSGAAGTALFTGTKVYSGSIGMSIQQDTLTHISEAAKDIGKSVGVVSSVQLSHATPASFVANNKSRNNYEEIARYMFFNSKADVIMAAGNPDFNDNGDPEQGNPHYVGGQEIWDMLKENDQRMVFETSEKTFTVKDIDGDQKPDPWTLIQKREDFVKMASGKTPKRVLGVPQVRSTLSQKRDETDTTTGLPYENPMNENIATLEEMTKAAINVLKNNDKGFIMMVEGGAIDWASHGNQSDRVIEEQIEFNNAVNAAIEWIENNSNWEETLVIVTADHECGYLTGPGEPNPLYPSVINNGKNNLPDMAWHHGGHTNVLVPFYAKGKGAEMFEVMAGENDPVYGKFLQNTDIAELVYMMWGKPSKINKESK